MSSSSQIPWFLTGVISVLVLVAYSSISWVLSTLRPKAYPPGPPVTPGLGNLLQIPVDKPYLQFHKWAKQYGDIVGLKTGAGNLVILNKPELVHELFNKRGAIYSNRPVNYVLTKLVSYKPEEKSVPILQYDDYYRRWRKAFNYILGRAGIQKLMPLLEAEACNLTRKLLDGGQNYEGDIRAWSLAVPLIVTNGSRLEDLPAGYADEFYHAQESVLKLMVPGSAPPVDVFPILKYLPEFLASWKKEARHARMCLMADVNKYIDGGWKQFRQLQRDPGSVGFESLVTKILHDQSEADDKTNHFTDTELAFIGQAAVGAAVDTTASTFKALLLILAAHPEVLAKVQQELDKVAGNTPPRAEQIDELHYLTACLSEVLRWRPTTPSGVPHALTQDDRLGDYYFPKGTTFIANAWTIHRNEEEYDRPDDFVPERFMDNPYGMRGSLGAQDWAATGRRPLYAFGSGRRQCPGELFAYTAILLAASKILWAYDILPPPEGIDVSIETGYMDGVVAQPINANVGFKLRSGRTENVILEDLDRTQMVAHELLGEAV